MPPAPRDRPSDLDGIYHPLFTDPDNELGYIKIHKCGTNTYAQHFRQRLGWYRTFREGSGLSMRAGFRANPNPKKILVIVRDPVDRYLAGMMQIGGSKYNQWVVDNIHGHQDALYTHERNQHVWPFWWFLSEWMHFFDRMEFVDIKQSADWLVANGVPLPPEGERHRNAHDPDEKRRFRDAVLSDERVLPRIQEYYTHDYELLEPR